MQGSPSAQALRVAPWYKVARRQYRPFGVWFALVQQGAVTVAFWASACRDQLYAQGGGDSSASWLGGGLVFLTIAAAYQFRVMRLLPTATQITMFAIQAASVAGNLACFVIFAVRRWSWTTNDTICAVTVSVIVVASMAVYTVHQYRSRGFRGALRYYAATGFGPVAGIAFRSVPRVFQGVSLFVNNTLSDATIGIGCYIALARLWTVTSTYRRTRSSFARCAFWLELGGNALSQAVLSICWIAAVAATA